MSIVGRKSRPEPESEPEAEAEGDGDARASGLPSRRGRPARLSRQRIIDAVLSILEREPNGVPTIASIAREVEAVPAALYRHFESLEDLFDCVMAGILEASQTRPDGDEAWPQQLERWMRDLRAHLLRYPAILAMIGRSGRTSPAWLDASSALVDILGRAGLSGRELAATYLWVLETTVGLVMQEAMLPLVDQIAQARASRRDFSTTARERFRPIERVIEEIDGEAFFSFVVEQAIAVVARKAAARAKAGNPT